MVMQIEPIDRCISALKAEREYDEVIFTSPDGEQFNQKMANDLSLGGNLIILAGHYKGVDQRVRDHLITKRNIDRTTLYLQVASFRQPLLPCCGTYHTRRNR